MLLQLVGRLAHFLGASEFATRAVRSSNEALEPKSSNHCDAHLLYITKVRRSELELLTRTDPTTLISRVGDSLHGRALAVMGLRS